MSAPIAKNGENFPSMSELKLNIAKKMLGPNMSYSPIQKDKSHLLKYLPKSQDEMPPRSMEDSFLVGIIPLSKDKALQDKYVTFLGHVRIGRLLEDMDIFAVMVCYKHIVNPKLPENETFPYNLVTVLVDRIDFTDYVPKSNEDIKISGHVSWVGKSSMEVVVWLEQKQSGVWQRVTRALFLLAARDVNNVGAGIVNSIIPANEREKQILAGGETRKKRRQELQKKNLAKVIPDAEEQKTVHDLFVRTVESSDVSLRNRVLPADCIWMSDATISNVIFSQPEDRNLHNTVFGGFMMRQALELSWVLGLKFSKLRPVLKSISDIQFNKPVKVNSLIQMHGHVVYTNLNYFQITTFTETFNPITGKIDTSNSFHFTYYVPELVKEVIPMTYQEAMMYIDGRRHFNEVMHKTELRNA
ncbi:unnamed protein product [Acanthoscelides obtectus]|uniref:HotDog ACOT-type domain-containing protein n=1 Tax=Acanthoscelides obtectus TaxID=200917 RepID=A0A9P0PYQ3_ACAOB|nr:unnamed protein product [Acanthoscelides obtectus]CAK1621511.1 Acyl-coenzyme A thioesterase 9, mitochondrial [Acanthoscelides obtectus]